MDEEKISLIFETISRIDEKIKIIYKKQNELDKKNEYIQKSISNLEAQQRATERLITETEIVKKELHELDIRLKSLEIIQNGTDQRWKTAINFLFQTLWVVLTSYLLMKIGLTEGLGIL
jgi:septal ring factor EnvC (AmiA/AmiB activator)